MKPFIFQLKKPKDTAARLLCFDDGWPSWTDLSSRIAKLFSISLNNVRVIFISEAEGNFTLGSEEDLQSYYQLFNPTSGEIKGFVQDLQTDFPNTITSSWSEGSDISDLANANDGLILFCWVLNVSNNPFPVDIEKGMTAGQLKDVIKKKKEHTFDGIDPDTIELWKLSPPISSAEIDTKLRDVQSPQQILGCVKLNGMDELLGHFSSAPRKHLHIIVEAPPTWSNRVKRPGAPDVDRKESKKPRIDTLPSESALDALHHRLQNIDPDPSRYSDPSKMTKFPFPFVGNKLPADRFDLKDFHFEYIGRTVFSGLLQTVEELKLWGGYTRLYIQGTMGYGKSHIIAVLAALLSRNGKRVVYLPNCRELAGDTLHYMQVALLCAFADPSSSGAREEIRALKSQDHIIRFCRQYPLMYIVIDQMDALDHEGSNMDPLEIERKAATRTFLDRLNSGQYRITSTSASYWTAVHADMTQTNERKLRLMGGMSEDEMQQWWIHHKNRVPIFEAEDKARIEDLTGRIPLLLRPLLHFANKPFQQIEQEFWTHRDLTIVGENVRGFADEKEANEGQNYERYYLPTLVGCVTSTRVIGAHRWFDYRYFYYDDEDIGNCTCGLARQAAALVISQASPALMCGYAWILSLRIFMNNPSVVGFLVEQACLSSISLTGFHHYNIEWGSMKATLFKGDLLEAIPPGSSEIFFIPENTFFKDIDALYLQVDAVKKTALVVPIQITVSKAHKDSEAAFYSRWSDWQKLFKDYTLKTTFVWVVEDDQSWTEIEEEIRKIRNKSNLISPEHVQVVVTVGHINNNLGLQLAQIRQ